MKRRPLRWRVLDAADRVRDGIGCAAATAVTAIIIGATALPRRRKPGPEQWLASRRAAHHPLTNPKGTQK
ncbi:MAG: hypothetical protein QJR12_16960 [Mycobacterium sp.]|nr:hypothetical protein [Mycobacterium sp.]